MFRTAFMSAIATAITRMTGFTVIRDSNHVLATSRYRFESLLELVLLDRMRRTGRPITFIQVGAYDGRSNDPLNHLIRTYGWRGLLIEPQPHAYELLKKTYQDQPQLIFKNVAIAEDPGERSLFSFRSGNPAIPDWLCQTASFDRRFLAKFKPCLPVHLRRRFGKIVVEHRVKCITIAEAAKELGAAHDVDLLQIDAEGYDWRIIRSLNMDHCAPAVIRYESRHLTNTDARACVNWLGARGYRFLAEQHDMIAYRRECLYDGLDDKRHAR